MSRHAAHPQLVSGADGAVLFANAAYAALVGTTEEAVLGTGPADVTHPDDLPLLLESGRRLLMGEINRMDLELRLRRADDEVRWCTVSCVLARDQRDVPLYVTQILDITERRAIEYELRISQARFQTLADSVPVGIQLRDHEGLLVYVNHRWSEITGLSADQAIGRGLLSIIHPDDRAEVMRRSLAIKETGEKYQTTYRVLRPDGFERWVTSRSALMPAEDDNPPGYVGSLDDITELVEAEMSANRRANILETTRDLVWIIDNAWLLTWCNAAAREAFGLKKITLPINADVLYSEASLTKLTEEIRLKLLRGEAWAGELEMIGPGEVSLWVRQSLAPQFDAVGTVSSIAALAHDATERRRIGDQLAHQANHDPLTGLPNRALLLERLTAAIATRSAPDATIAVLFLDVDNFKLVNDRFGHQVGDQLLCVIAERLSSVLRSTDLVGRIGGDEFVIVCPNLPHQGPAEDTARRTLAAVSQTPISADGHLLSITASVGITLLTEDRDVGPETLIREADTAMYTAKSLGRNRVESFDRTVRVAHPNQEPAPTVHP